MVITSHLQWKSSSKSEVWCRESLPRAEIGHRLPKAGKASGKTNDTGEGRQRHDTRHDTDGTTQIGKKTTD